MMIGIFFAMIFFFVLGCSDTSEPDPNQSSPIHLAGDFESDCYSYTNDEGKKRSAVRKLSLNQTVITYQWISHAGSVCESEKKRFRYVWNLHEVQVKTKSDLEGWESYTSRVQSIVATVHRPQTVEGWNKVGIFGFSNWALNSGKQVHGLQFNLKSAPLPQANSLRHYTIKIEGEKLFQARYVDGKPSGENPWKYRKIQNP